MRFKRAVRRFGAIAALAACHVPLATVQPAIAQREGLIPAGFGSLRRDDVIEVRITEACVMNHTPPLLEISGKRQKKEA